jgi:hypothetical protein
LSRDSLEIQSAYGARHRKGLPIDSSIAESAVNQRLSCRMVKKRKMRWTDEGAHCMAQVRVAVLNGEFSSRRISALKIAESRYGKCVEPASAGGHPSTDGTDLATMPFCTLSFKVRRLGRAFHELSSRARASVGYRRQIALHLFMTICMASRAESKAPFPALAGQTRFLDATGVASQRSDARTLWARAIVS